ncbi:MAG: phosphoribosylanthranilate isomerase [Verrucomicrobiae bacterium]|nr:phosphoribosylanthranilate isomerase [Verrucomicrobiae bacterium]
MPIKVKICGITNLEDALAAVEFGADALGFIFYPKSPRYITPDDAAKIRRIINPFVRVVGVFVDESYTFINSVDEQVNLDFIQLHGNESPELCRLFEEKTIKAFRVKDSFPRERLMEYKNVIWLLDTFAPDTHGGTGTTFDWQIALRAKEFNPNIILSGGLTPENVADAVKMVKPIAVDVASGVESAPGKKDREKLKRFIKNAKIAGFEM